MTPSHRARLAAPVLAIYWLMILAGLTLFTVARTGDMLSVAPLWFGAIAGTLLGHYLALHDFRFWIVALIIFIAAVYCGPLLPSGEGSVALWQAFIPAALCGYWSLGDRGVLAAAWFPIVLWMLTILDRSEQALVPDGAAAVLLGSLVVLFVLLLRARESRRVGLWRSVAAEPLAQPRPLELLREPPGRQLARAAWGLSTGAIAIALAVWLAPPLWQTETLGGDPIELAAEPGDGLPCCPRHRTADPQSARVREYFDLGLGHDEHALDARDGDDCRACPEPATTVAVPGLAVTPGEPIGGIAVAAPEIPGVAGRPAAAGTVVWGQAGEPTGTTVVAPGPSAPVAAADRPTTDLGSPIETTLGPGPSAPVAAADRPTTDPGSSIETTLGPEPVVAGAVREPDEVLGPETLPSAPAPPPLPAAAPVAPVPPPPAAAPAPPPQQTAAARPSAPHRPTSHAAGPALLPWLTVLAMAALLLQLVRIGLRPLRRLITLRHLRRPFWDETVDQRVSNSWQLALIGLCDAGWRAGATEAPQQLARRVGVDGLERCATVLERARHGVGIDADDLTDMQASAGRVYRAARAGLGGFARAIAWLRWPLT